MSTEIDYLARIIYINGFVISIIYSGKFYWKYLLNIFENNFDAQNLYLTF